MNSSSRLFPRLASMVALSCVCVLAFVSTTAIADQSEQAKLKELQRALTAPKEEAEEFSAKAIVFDKDDSGNVRAQAVPAQQQQGTTTDCSLVPTDVRSTAVDFQIQFKVGSAELSPVSENTVLQIAKILALTPERCVFVEGHTDATGRPDANLRLSRERADSVVRFITDKAGVLRNRLITIGKGSTEPLQNIAPTDPKNRRVVFKVVN